MEPIFTLSYPEFTVAQTLQKYFKKADDYSVQIPLSRQQKGIDLLLYNRKSKKAVSFQIKSSRSWQRTIEQIEKKKFQHSSWFHRFEYTRGVADYYIFFILFPKTGALIKSLAKAKKPAKWWGYKILVFNDEDMSMFLSKIKTKKGNPDKFFYIAFNEESDDIYATRGFPSPEPVTNKLLDNKTDEIKAAME